MNNLMRQLLDDWKPFIKESHWNDFVRQRMESIDFWGDIVRIEDEYYPNSNRLSKRRYYNARGTANVVLEHIRATGSFEKELKLAPIPDLIVDEPVRSSAKREPPRMTPKTKTAARAAALA